MRKRGRRRVENCPLEIHVIITKHALQKNGILMISGLCFMRSSLKLMSTRGTDKRNCRIFKKNIIQNKSHEQVFPKTDSSIIGEQTPSIIGEQTPRRRLERETVPFSLRPRILEKIYNLER